MALLFTVLCGAVALTLGYFINYFAKGHFVHSTQAVLDTELRYINAIDTLPEQLDKTRIYLPLSNEGTLPETWPKPSNRLAEGLLIFEFPQEDQIERYAARIYTLNNGQKLLIGVNITSISNDFDFMQLIGIASIAFVMIVVFVSYMISIFVVKGTNQIAETAHDIIRTGDLSRRVEMKSRWDDLGNVAGLLNLLFDRVEELMQGVRQVSDNIAHDLRTPLTRMRSHIEILQKQEPDNNAYNELLIEADHILNTFNALLRISRLETEKQRSRFAGLSLSGLLTDVIEFYEPLAEDKSISLYADIEECEYFGDRDLLFQAFANLLDNAIKFTPKNGSIALKLHKSEEHIVITMTDSGKGVDDKEISKIFDRFYRGEKSRSTSGSGLGLSLVSAVISLHDGQIKAQNTDQGFQIITIL